MNIGNCNHPRVYLFNVAMIRADVLHQPTVHMILQRVAQGLQVGRQMFHLYARLQKEGLVQMHNKVRVVMVFLLVIKLVKL